MKRANFIILLLAVSPLLMGGVGYPEDEYAIGPITKEQAKQAIINWAGRTNLNIVEVPQEEIFTSDAEPIGKCAAGGLKGIHPTAHGAYATCYAFDVGDPNPDHKYSLFVYVDSYSGAIARVYKGEREVREGTIADMLPPQQAINLARQLVASYFPNIPVYSFEGVETSPKITSDGSWEEYDFGIDIWLYNRVQTPAGEEVELCIQEVFVAIDAWTGRVDHIDVTYEPLEINPVPTLTMEEAIQSLISYLYGLGADYVEIIDVRDKWFIARESPNGPQRLFMIVNCFVTEPLDSNIFPSNFLTCGVDGYTGEIVWGNFVFWSGFPLPEREKKATSPSLFFDGREKKAKPILKGKKIYLNIEDIKQLGFKVEKTEDGYAVSYKEEKATFGADELLKQGSEVFIEGGSLSKLKGVMTYYIEETKQFHIWIKNEKAYQRGVEDRQKLGKGKSLPKSPPSPQKGKVKPSSGVIGGTLFLSLIGYALWKFLRFWG